MNDLWRDFRYAVRMLSIRPAFSATALISLALGIGACTTIFSIVNSVLLRSLPYPEPERIVRLLEVSEKGSTMNFADPNYADLRSRNSSFEALAHYTGALKRTVTGGGQPVRVSVYAVSNEFFTVMGVQPLAGRAFSPGENRSGDNRVVVVSYDFWQRLLGGKPDFAEAALRIDNQSFSVIGIMPPGFRFPAEAEAWIPREIYPELPSRTAHNWRVIGRLRSDVSLETARGDISAIGKQLREQLGAQTDAVDFAATPLHDSLTGKSKQGLLILFAAVGFLLLTACANVANMQLAQATVRRTEFAVRVALGASRMRLALQAIIESLLLTLAAGALGLLLSLWGVDLALSLNRGNLPRPDEIGVDLRALGFTFLISLFVGVMLGLGTAFKSSQRDLYRDLKENARGQSASLAASRLRGLLVVSQVALTLILLVGAGLLSRSFVKLLQVDPGFHPESAVAMDISLPFSESAEEAVGLIRFHGELIERLSRMPGVIAVGGIDALPMTESGSDGQFLIDNNPNNTGHAEYRVASADYFAAMGIPLQHGRLFDQTDRAGSPHVAVISEALARRLWPNQEPLGKQIQFGNMDGYKDLITIVGIVGNVRDYGLDAKPTATVYVNGFQRPRRTYDFSIVVRARTDPATLIPAMRREVQELNSELPMNFRTLGQVFSSSIAQRRFSLVIFGIFAAVSLMLAITGIYGVVSYSVAQRTREIGVRMALGAQVNDVVKLILGAGMKHVLVGTVIGFAGALALTRWLESMLFDVSATDPLTFAAVVMLLIIVALLACGLPARKAAKTDPIAALRYE